MTQLLSIRGRPNCAEVHLCCPCIRSRVPQKTSPTMTPSVQVSIWKWVEGSISRVLYNSSRRLSALLQHRLSL